MTSTAMAIVKTVIGYFLGFIALAVFAWLSFSQGKPTEATWRFAFMVSGAIAVAELFVLVYLISKPANRLVIAANIYLALGGLAFAFDQEWFLRKYEQLGLSAILLLMFVVGIVSTIFSSAGFVGTTGDRIRTRQASYILIALVALGVVVAQTYPAIHKGAGVAIITALAFSNRALRAWVYRAKK
jgi:hypothetical protein